MKKIYFAGTRRSAGVYWFFGVEAPKKSTDANIFGHVVDRDTHEHIPYATIAVTARHSVPRPTLRGIIS